MLLAYAVAGLVLTGLYVRLAARPAVARAPVARPATGALGLGRSRGVVLQLAGLQGLDALAGGFIMQSLVAYWLHLRFDASPEALGALFFGTNLLSALSFLVATRVAERVGLLNTMVFTHLPSNVLLLAVPFMPSFASASLVLLARHLLSQMDVPTRQAYAVALVAPEERAAAAGFTVSVRALVPGRGPGLRGSHDGDGRDAAAVPVRRRAQDRLRPAAVLPLPPRAVAPPGAPQDVARIGPLATSDHASLGRPPRDRAGQGSHEPIARAARRPRATTGATSASIG